MYNEFRLPEGISAQIRKVAELIGSMGKDEFITSELAETSSYLLRHPGKMMRPALVFLGAEFAGERRLDRYVGLAASIELLHTSSLIHDDMIDKDMERRGMESVHARYGMEAAVLAGDALISKAIEKAVPYGSEVVSRISSSAMSMCAGEMLDYNFQKKRQTPSLAEYLGMAELKSSVLIGTSVGIAALHSADGIFEQVYNAGVMLGTAFQVRDDILDFRNDSRRNHARPNAVVSIAKERGNGTEDAIAEAVRLNNKYVSGAIEVFEKRHGSMLCKYAKDVAVGPKP